MGLDYFASTRLLEYWMSEAEINSFCEEAVAFGGQLAAEHPALDRIPIAVYFEVCTVHQQGELYDATRDRAITEDKLTPLYLWEFQTVANKPTTFELMDFFIYLNRIRVEDVEVRPVLMPACPICSRGPCLGDQISVLTCHCDFHSQCIIRKLESDNLCPGCRAPAYDASFLKDPFCYFDRDA